MRGGFNLQAGYREGNEANHAGFRRSMTGPYSLKSAGATPGFHVMFPDEECIVQAGSDVGQRMDNAICYTLENGARKAVIYRR